MELETRLEVTERSASKSESQRLVALDEIIDIYGFGSYPCGAQALIDRVIQSEKRLRGSTSLPDEVELIIARLRGDLESVLQKGRLAYTVLTRPKREDGRTYHFIHPVINDEDGLQELILRLDPDVQTYILASNGDAYLRTGAKELPEDYEEMLERASGSHEIITEESVFSFYGFGYTHKSPADIAAAFQRNGSMLMSNVFRGLLNLFRRIRGNQAYDPRRIWQEVENFDGNGYLILRKSRNRVYSEQFSDRDHLLQYLELCNPEANNTDTFWIISPKAVYLKPPLAVVEREPAPRLDSLTDLESDILSNP